MDNPAGFVIPLVSIVLGILMIIVSIVTKHRRQMQELDNRHRERMAAIEKGLDLPPDTVVERAAAVERSRGYRRTIRSCFSSCITSSPTGGAWRCSQGSLVSSIPRYDAAVSPTFLRRGVNMQTSLPRRRAT